MALAFALAFALRLLNAPFVFDGGARPRIAPVDELYHWKRIAWSAARFPHALEWDGDRGIVGAFCPWPPLYDVAAGGAARLLGANDADAVLSRIVWFPPLLFALFVAATVAALARTCGTRVAAIAGLAFASSPFLVTASWLGSIDHHYLEPALTFAILGAMCMALRRDDVCAGLLLAAAITAAMFVQTALLISAALAFAILFFASEGLAGMVGFAVAGIAVAAYRLTRAPGFPDNQWFLGWTHAALFAGAAVACGVRLLGRRSRAQLRMRAAALFAGALVVIATPSAFSSLISGAHFFGGDRWLRTIQEFQPIWRAHADDLASELAGFSAGALLVWFLLVRSWRTRDMPRLSVAFFAIAYVGLTITSRRFWIIAIPLLALAGALAVPLIARKRIAIAAALAVALIPPLQLAGWLMTPMPPVHQSQQQWLRATRFLHTLPAGRVLGPWSLGHAIDVDGGHAVIIDNFGTMPDPALFEQAQQALLSRDEASLARYCDRAGVRYLMLENPASGIASANAILGTNQPAPSTWWWHVWRGAAPRQFHLLWQEQGLRIYER